MSRKSERYWDRYWRQHYYKDYLEDTSVPTMTQEDYESYYFGTPFTGQSGAGTGQYTSYQPDVEDYEDLYDAGDQYVPVPGDILGMFLQSELGDIDISKWVSEYGAYIDPYDITKQKLLETGETKLAKK